MTLKEFLAVFTVNDPVSGRALNTTTNGGVDSLGDLLTLSDPAGGRAIKIAISGGVTKFWTEAYGAGTQATSSWTPTGAATNINAAIIPKGTGAIVADIPDGTATGGNARGAYAVDLQMARANQERIATGAYSVISGGYSNRIHPQAGAYGIYCAIGGGNNNDCYGGNASTIAGGDSNRTTYDKCFIGGGTSNQVNAGHGVVSGGQSNTVSGENATIGGGQSNTSSGSHSVVDGGQSNTVSGAHSNIAGGRGNTVSGSAYSTIAGGQNNSINQSSQSWQFIGGGSGNQVLNGYGVVCGGFANIAGSGGGYTHGQAFVGGGESNRAQQEYASVVGGRDNNSVGGYSFIGCGRDNRASGGYSSIVGGFQGTAFLHGQTSHASGQFSARGDAQAHELVWRAAVTGTTTTELFLDGSSAAAILPSTNAIWHGVIDVAAVCTAAGDGSTAVGAVEASSFKVTIKRIGTTTSLVGTVQEIGTVNADVSMATSVITIDNNDTNESLRIQFTPPGTAGSTTVIRVVATFRGLQIQY